MEEWETESFEKKKKKSREVSVIRFFFFSWRVGVRGARKTVRVCVANVNKYIPFYKGWGMYGEGRQVGYGDM